MSTQNSKLNKRKEVLKIIKDRFESSSILALSSFVKNENWLIKLTWIAFLLGSAFTCSWFISKSITDYYNYSVTTKTIIKNVNKLKFPIVSICNINPFTTNYSSQIILNSFPTSMIYNYSNGYDLLAKIAFQAANDSINKNLLGYGLNDIIINCLLLSKPCNIYSDFEQYYDINHGNCFRINSGKSMNGTSTSLKYVFNAGHLSALYIDLFMGADYNNENLFSIQNGFSIFISDEKQDSTTTQGIKISPGTATYIILDKYSIKKQPKPYSDCIADLTSINSYSSTCYKRVFSPNRIYHFTDCSYMCFQKFLGDNCGCQTTYLNYFYYSNMRVCSKEESTKEYIKDSDCLMNQWIKYSDSQTILQECDCPLECENSGYNFKISYAQYPTLIFFKSFLQNHSLVRSRFSNANDITFENVKNSVGRLIISFDEMKETYINEEVKTEVFDLISSVGGFLGLFLGFSSFSLIEIVEIILKILIFFFNLLVKKRRSQVKDNNDTN